MKKEVLDRCKNSSSLCKLDFHLEQNHFNHPDLGFGADTVIKDRLKDLVSNLIQTKWNIPRNGDEINSEYKRYIEKEAVGNRNSFLKFSKLKDRLDEFYFSSVGGLDEYPQLCKVIKMVVTLFDGQTSVERGFNISKAILQPSLMKKSLTSQRLVYDHMKARNSSVEPVVITKKLRHSVKRSQNQQRIDLTERKKQESDHVINIKELKAKKIALEKVEKKT